MLPNRHLHISFLREECLEEAFTFHQFTHPRGSPKSRAAD